MSEIVHIREVGPRDGLQNEQKWIDTADKVTWIEQLASTGISYIEMTSFVHPKWIPALADAADVVKSVKKKAGVTYGALVPNLWGLERALEVGVDEVAIFISASESHNLKNINKTIKDSLPVLKEVTERAKAEGLKVRGYVSTVFGCPYEGEISLNNVLNVSNHLLDMGIDELSLGDTIGIATPNNIEDVINCLKKAIPLEKIALHLHDTRGTALANIYAAYKLGIRKFDGSVAGLGGCPYAPGAAGNVATEDMVYLFEGLGVKTGIKLDELVNCAVWIQKKINRTLPSHHLRMRGGLQ